MTLIRNETKELSAIEVAKEASPMTISTDSEKLVQVMSTKIQALLSRNNTYSVVGKWLCVVALKHIGFIIEVL